jgi:SAM-dependent methyltransferase
MEAGAATPSTRALLQELILWCLGLDYISYSCKDGIQTGNHYQTVHFGESKTAGFRSDRAELMDKVDFRSKRVLDLGSNLGELARAARDRGAEIVDGFEYDPFFIEVAQLLNAYNSTTRVSFFRRDITNEIVYQGRYDLVMAFAVWTYVAPILQRISQITDVLLVETHNLQGNLQTDYVDHLTRFFPRHVVLGESDWGRNQDSVGRRVVLLCAKNDAVLTATLNVGAP